jgi:6-phosphogluconolactonase
VLTESSVIRSLPLFVCLIICACGRSVSNNGTGGTGGSSSSSTQFLIAVGGVDTLVFKLDSNANLKLVQTVQSGGNTSLALNNSPVQAPGGFVYVINPLCTGINAYSMSPGGTLTAVSGSPFLVPQSLLNSPQLGSLMVDPGSKRLYALDIGGSIVEAQMDTSTGALTFGSASVSAGFSPQYAAIDPAGKSIYVSQFIAGFTSTGESYAGIAGFDSDPSSGTVSLMPASPFSLTSNTQPCDIEIAPAGRFVYTALVNGDAVAAFSRDSTTGALTQIPGSPFPTSHSPSQTCSLAIHPSGKFLYALNLNGHDISGYSIDNNSGSLSPMAGSPFPPQSSPSDPSHTPFTQGPIAIDPSGKYLFVLTGDRYIAVYGINQTSGALSIAGSPRSIPEPVDALNLFQTN